MQGKATFYQLLVLIPACFGVLPLGGLFAAEQQIVPLRMITYNVHLLPDVAAKIAGKRSESDYRAIALGQALSSYDLIGINEAFDSRRSRAMIQSLQSHAPAKLTMAHGPARSGRHLIGSGLVLLSRWPITTSHTITYADASRFLTSGFKADGFAAKGALHAQIQIGSVPEAKLDVFLTHLESRSQPARQKQVQEFARFIRDHSDRSRPMVIMGDLNITADSAFDLALKADSTPYRRLLRTLAVSGYRFADLGWFNKQQPLGTSDAMAKHGGRRIDYIFFSQPDAAASVKLLPLTVGTKRFLDDRVPEGSLSDHAAVSCEATFCYRIATARRNHAIRR